MYVCMYVCMLDFCRSVVCFCLFILPLDASLFVCFSSFYVVFVLTTLVMSPWLFLWFKAKSPKEHDLLQSYLRLGLSCDLHFFEKKKWSILCFDGKTNRLHHLCTLMRIFLNRFKPYK
eukprot:Rmarinus@m.16029